MAAFGLVADYGTDSDSNSEPADSLSEEKRKESAPGVNFLSSEAVDTGSSEEEEEDDPVPQPAQPLDNPFAKKLPNPLADNHIGTKGSVFVTDYQIAEASKDSILEQHVKMTEAPNSQQKTIGGKKVCWNYRKTGRCNKGRKCPYAHDTDLPVTASKTEAPTEVPAPQHQRIQHSYHGRLPPPDPEDDDSYMGQAKRKKRCGVSDGLIPPKKAYTTLDHSRKKQRPWTQGGPT